jgi:hypothetical protein
MNHRAATANTLTGSTPAARRLPGECGTVRHRPIRERLGYTSTGGVAYRYERPDGQIVTMVVPPRDDE